MYPGASLNAPSLSEFAWHMMTSSSWKPLCSFRRERDGAVDTFPARDLRVPVRRDIRGAGAGFLQGLGDEARAVVAAGHPPQQRVGNFDFGLLQTLDELHRLRRHLVVGVVADVAEVVRVDLLPVLGLGEKRFRLPGAERGLADNGNVPVQLGTRVDDAREEAGIDAPWHDGFGTSRTACAAAPASGRGCWRRRCPSRRHRR